MRLVTEVIDRERTALGELVLERYVAPDGTVGHQVSIDGAFLMATHGCASERSLASLAWRRLAHREGSAPGGGLSCLVGGLGAGHTLRAALDLPGVRRVVVVEVGAMVFDWNRRFFAEANGHAVEDPRVETVVGDLHDVLPRFPGAFDLALLDVDNGPGWLAAPGNARLYRPEGLRRCREALRPGGVLAVWSPQRNPVFLETLRQVFPDVEEIATTAISRAAGEIPDVVYLASR
ncbi:spermidine synthase [Myxococcota bacterium]|nr:spermidine synthase [Myxococcota bacterium]